VQHLRLAKELGVLAVAIVKLPGGLTFSAHLLEYTGVLEDRTQFFCHKMLLDELTRVLQRMNRLSLEKLDVHVVEAGHHDAVPDLIREITGALP
jgi:hypothetical protein